MKTKFGIIKIRELFPNHQEKEIEIESTGSDEKGQEVQKEQDSSSFPHPLEWKKLVCLLN